MLATYYKRFFRVRVDFRGRTAVHRLCLFDLVIGDHFIPTSVDHLLIPTLSLAPEYDIRLCGKDDEAEVVKLLEDVFDGWPNHDVESNPLEHWRWKHLDNPLGRSLVLVTESMGEIVASNHSCFFRAKAGGGLSLGVVASDLAVDRGHRRKGVRNAMMVKKHEHLERMGVEFILAATGNPIVIESMPTEDVWLKRTGYKTLRLLSKIRSRERLDPSKRISIRRVRRFPARIDEFWEENLDSYDFIVERSSEYLNWRYCDPRAGNYEVYLAEKGEELLGYAVAGVNRAREDYPVGYVADLVVGGDGGDVSAALLEHVVDRLNVEGVNIVLGLAVKGSGVESAYASSGFVDSRERLELFITPVGDSRVSEAVKGFKPERVHYSWGDHDSLPTSITRN
jgi:GNAT superfamily N-acetyltransferase